MAKEIELMDGVLHVPEAATACSFTEHSATLKFITAALRKGSLPKDTVLRVQGLLGGDCIFVQDKFLAIAFFDAEAKKYRVSVARKGSGYSPGDLID